MSAQARTLQYLMDSVADRADIKIGASGTRHTTAKVTDCINRAIRRWKLWMAEAGDDADLVTKRVQTNPSATRDATNWAPQMYLTQPQPADFPFALLRGMDIWATPTRPVAMMPVDDAERDDAFRGWLNSGGTGMPVFYRLGGATASAPLIQIFPWANAVYDVDIRYIPVWVDKTNPSDLVEFIMGFDEWVVNDAAVQSLITDGQGAGAAAQMCRAWNEKMEQDFRFTLAKRSPIRKVDTRERRRELMQWANPAWRSL